MSLKTKAVIAVLISLGLLAIYHAVNYWVLFGGAGAMRSPTDGELLMSTFAVSMTAVLQTLLLYRLVIYPIRELDKQARFLGDVEDIEEGTTLPETASEELASLAHSFNNLLSTVQRLKQELQRSEARHNAYLDQSSEGIWRVLLDAPLSPNLLEAEQLSYLETNSRLVECNTIFAGIAGHGDPHALTGLSLTALFADTDLDGLPLPQAFVRNNYNLKNVELRLSSGSRRGHFLLSMTGLFEEGLLIGCWGTLLDITERKEHEDILRSSEERFRTMADSAPVMIWVSDAGRKDTYFNRCWLDFTGRSLEQELFDGWLAGMHPDDVDHYYEVSGAAIEARRDFIVEYRLRRNDGKYRWVVDHGTPCFSLEGLFTGYIGTCMDVTEQREMVHALKESEERYRNLVDNMSEGLALVDESERLIFVNPAAVKIFGVEKEQLTGMSLGDFVDEQQFNEVLRHTAMRRSGVSSSYELQISRPNGEKRFIWLTATPRLGLQGNFAGAFAVFQDITDKRQAEQEKRDSEERYKQLVNSMSEGVAIYDNAGRYVYLNHIFSELWEIPWQEMIGKTPQQIGGNSTGFAVEGRRREEPEHTGRYEISLTDTRGRQRSFIVSNQQLRNADGDEVGSFALITDTTDIREAEAARMETEERLQRLVENMSEGILIVDECGRCIYANQATESIHGVGKDALLGLDVREIVPEDQIARFDEEIDVIRSGDDRRFELEIQRGERERRRVLVSVSPIIDASGEFQGAFAVLLDITERKRDEELQSAQRRILEMMVGGRPLEEILESTALMVEEQITDCICSINLLDPTGMQFMGGAGPNVPNAISKVMEGQHIGPRIGSCGTAAHTGRPVISVDVMSDPNWIEHASWIASEASMRACWAWPILSPGGKVLGTLALYFRHPREPKERELAQIEIMTNIAGLAINRQHSEEALRLSEARFRHIYDNAPVMIQSIDQQGRYINVNLKWMEETGYSREEVLGQPMEFVMTRDSARKARDKTSRFWKEGFLRDTPYQFQRKDGSPFDVLVNSVVTDDPGGGRIRLSVVSNVSERRRAEEALNRLATAVGQTAEGIIITNIKGIVQYVNPALQSITGYSTDEIIGNDPENLHLLGDDKSIYERLKLNSSADKAWKGRFSLKRRDGTDCEGEATISPVRDQDGRIVNFVTVMRDVTKEIALQSKLQHADKAESLAVLAGGIAHDFNNLLMGIIGNASLALTEIAPTSMASRRINDIEVAGQRAAELARQMLAYSGKGRFIMEIFDVSRLVGEMVSLMEVTISKSVKLNLNLATGLPKIEADATQIRQVVMNLLTNANESMQDRKGSITLMTTSEWCTRETLASAYFDDDLPEAHYVIIEVADSGCGMDETTLKKVFDPFFTTKFTGHGLGMAAVLGIVRGHRGTIIVNSTPGVGTTFRVLLPCSTHLEPITLPDERPIEDWQGSGTVLVVDDEETVRKVVEQILQKAGFKVLLAVDGRDGIDKFTEHQDEITAVLLDMTMPNVNGQEAFKEMKRIREDALVIMSSGFNERETTYRIMGMGLGGFIQKPYRARDLISKLRELIEVRDASLQTNGDGMSHNSSSIEAVRRGRAKK